MSGCTNCNNGGCGGCGSLTVPEGPQGIQGPAGAAGAAGPAGADGAPGPSWQSWSWSRGLDLPHIETGGNAVFKVAAEVIYPGTAVVPVPGFVKLQTFGQDASPNYDLQLYDATNAQVLAQITARTQTTATIDSLTVVGGSWPAATARLQVRVRDNNAVNDQVVLYDMTWHN